MISQEQQKKCIAEGIRKQADNLESQAGCGRVDVSIRLQSDEKKLEKINRSISSRYRPDITLAKNSSTLQEAGSAEGSYRPSILDEYQRQDYNRIQKPLPHPHEEEMQEKLHSPKRDQQFQDRISLRLTRMSSITPKKLSFQDSTNSILHMIATQIAATQKRRSTLLNSINEAVKCLSKGVLLRKCCFNRFKIETVVLTFSEDFQFMSIFQLEKSQMKVYCMKDFTSVLKGFKTHKFHEYLEKGYTLDEQSSFSILLRERTFDFLAENPQHCENIVRKIQLLNEST